MSTRVRSSDHFRDRSTASSSSSSSSRCLQSYFLPFFFFEQERRQDWGKFHTNGVSLYYSGCGFSGNWKPRRKSFPKCLTLRVSDSFFFRLSTFLFYFLFFLPRVIHSFIEWTRKRRRITESLFFSSRRKNYFQRLIIA